ncbi:hypothetical protein OEZ85_005606 [Tetradesmus obliquus]|uniref:MLO-like protein n=1 Tax=Tetradesmus obliquus TaxID=3088 RepID=A0ABY8UDV3_TETOB|nr:hypothetical protein OEZ85_005606 [Tetradesmus obliquus]
MAGGGSSNPHARGLLETSPGAIAVIIVFFLVVTLGFEKGLHHVKHSLKRRKKLGLLAAVDNLSSELMLLSVATLLLTALAPAITTICMPQGNTYKPWLSNVKGCACCLAKTKGVTPCFMQERECPADFKKQCNPYGAYLSAIIRRHEHKEYVGDTAKANTSAAGYAAAYAAGKQNASVPAAAAASPAAAKPVGQGNGKRRLAAAAGDAGKEEKAECSGTFLESYAECDYRPGWAPEVSMDMLNQVHMLLFVMAAVHILVSMLVLLGSTLKLK